MELFSEMKMGLKIRILKILTFDFHQAKDNRTKNMFSKEPYSFANWKRNTTEQSQKQNHQNGLMVENTFLVENMHGPHH